NVIFREALEFPEQRLTGLVQVLLELRPGVSLAHRLARAAIGVGLAYAAGHALRKIHGKGRGDSLRRRHRREALCRRPPPGDRGPRTRVRSRSRAARAPRRRFRSDPPARGVQWLDPDAGPFLGERGDADTRPRLLGHRLRHTRPRSLSPLGATRRRIQAGPGAGPVALREGAWTGRLG